MPIDWSEWDHCNEHGELTPYLKAKGCSPCRRRKRLAALERVAEAASRVYSTHVNPNHPMMNVAPAWEELRAALSELNRTSEEKE